MWEKIKAYFRGEPPATVEILSEVVEPKSMVFTPQPAAQLSAPNTTFRRGMWVVMGNQIGIVAGFKGADIEFHHVDRETGLTIKEEQISSLRLRQAKFDEIPPCRWGLSREVAERMGYGS